MENILSLKGKKRDLFTICFILSLFLFIPDEVGALVFDAGSHTFRVGFAGEEYPKVSHVTRCSLI